MKPSINHRPLQHLSPGVFQASSFKLFGISNAILEPGTVPIALLRLQRLVQTSGQVFACGAVDFGISQSWFKCLSAQ